MVRVRVNHTARCTFNAQSSAVLPAAEWIDTVGTYLPKPTQQALMPNDMTWQEPCDEVVGQESRASCSALQLLTSLSEELATRDAISEAEMGENGSANSEYDGLHRAARFFMYRAFVAAKYGYLGHDNRVRIPLCVVTAIRARYRAAGCDCAMCDLASCTAHGYVGHKER